MKSHSICELSESAFLARGGVAIPSNALFLYGIVMTRPAFALNVLLASLLLSSAASAAGYQLKVSIPNLPPAVWPSCTTPWGSSLAHTGKVFAYSAESVSFGESCDTVKQERTCNKGQLSGTYSNQACTPLTACPGGGTQAYATAGTFSFTLPQGCSSATLTAKVWGAAGGGGGSTGSDGGGGGYASSTTTVTSGNTLTVVVGGGGSGGSGGGASAVLLGVAELAVGGGGGGGHSWHTYSKSNGMPGGNSDTTFLGTTHAGVSIPASSTYWAWSGGGASSYGSGGMAMYQGVSGFAYIHAGGGGGYLGGKKATCCAYAYGGSSYASNGTTIGGAGANPGNASDPDYVAPAGVGVGSNGGPGRVVLTWQ